MHGQVWSCTDKASGQERMYGQFEVKHVRLSLNVRTNVGVRTYAQDNMKMRHIIVRTYETVSALE